MQNRTVAIIDDNQDSLKELEKILTMAGYATILVDEILGAVDIVINNKPDVILMELKMPHRNGFALADAINRVFGAKKIPIIAMSNMFKDEFKWLMDFCGIKRWIKKPFLPLDVIWAVENEMEEDIQWDMESVGMEYDSQKSFK
jgi:two-component system response regulator AdeR